MANVSMMVMAAIIAIVVIIPIVMIIPLDNSRDSHDILVKNQRE